MIALQVFCCFICCLIIANANQIDEWKQFKLQYGKVYTSVEEDMYRQSVFHHNRVKIEQHNELYEQGDVSFQMSINKYADMTHEEFLNVMVHPDKKEKIESYNASQVSIENSGPVPEFVDWRLQGYVTPVQDQGQCLCGWAFAALGSLEGQHYKTTFNLVQLSPQNLIDCSSNSTDGAGCSGGDPVDAFDYIIVNKGVDKEVAYPFEAMVGDCRFKKEDIGATATSYVLLPTKDELALKKAVATIGPIAVNIDASLESFQFYSKDVYYDSDCKSTAEFLRHSVLVVGYGTTNGTDYWIVKNSWSSTWGNQGYILMSRNRHNNCGISTKPIYPKNVKSPE